jgi:signal peptidase I
VDRDQDRPLSEPDKRVRQPRPLWAGLLSLLFPGLGQVYAGAFRLGVMLFVLGIVGHLLLGGLTRISAPEPAAVAVFIALGIVGILYRLAIGVAAFRLMRRGFRDDPGRRWYRSTWIAAIVMVAITGLATELIAPNASDSFGWRPFRIASGSALPTLRVDERVMADIRHPEGPVTPGDLVIFINSRQSNAHWVDRVIALPGDTVQMRGGILYLNGKPVPRTAAAGQPGRYRETLPSGRSYDILQKTDNGPADNTAEFKIPPGSFFVLCDNRSDCLDSRSLQWVGYIPQANLTGVLHTVFWSGDFSRLLLRIR